MIDRDLRVTSTETFLNSFSGLRYFIQISLQHAELHAVIEFFMIATLHFRSLRFRTKWSAKLSPLFIYRTLAMVVRGSLWGRAEVTYRRSAARSLTEE